MTTETESAELELMRAIKLHVAANPCSLDAPMTTFVCNIAGVHLKVTGKWLETVNAALETSIEREQWLTSL